jgi:hypothetical protein
MFTHRTPSRALMHTSSVERFGPTMHVVRRPRNELRIATMCGVAMLALVIGVAQPQFAAAATRAPAIPRFELARLTTPSGAPNALSGVSCATPTFCVAVGFVVTNGLTTPLIEHSVAGRWSMMASPSTASVSSYLDQVACVSVTQCMAVGTTQVNNSQRTLAEHWNGKRWSVVAARNPGSKDAFQSVACPSSSECLAVGTERVGTLSKALVER